MLGPSPVESATSTVAGADVISCLSTADVLRLLKVGRVFALGTRLDPDDLFQEALTRVLDERRRCPPGVDPVVFVANAMRSIADADRKAIQREQAALAEAELTEERPASGKTPPPEVILTDAERQAACKKAVDDLFGLFADDEEAQTLLLGDLYGHSADEIRQMNDMDETEYATVRRRMRRKMNRAYPKGWTT